MSFTTCFTQVRHILFSLLSSQSWCNYRGNYRCWNLTRNIFSLNVICHFLLSKNTAELDPLQMHDFQLVLSSFCSDYFFVSKVVIPFHNNGSDSGLVYSLPLKLLGSFDCSIFAICGFLALEVRFYKPLKRNYFDNMSCIQEQQQILLPYDICAIYWCFIEP